MTRRATLLGGAILAVGLLASGAGGCAKKVTTVPAPSNEESAARAIEHEVVAGETLGLIADNYYGDPDRAADIARDNGLTDPDRIVPGSVLSLRFDADEWDSARRRAAALVPYNRGVDLLAQEKLGEAERQFRLALGTAPDLYSARYNLALVLIKRGRVEEALPMLEELTDKRPDDKDFLFARGHALFLATRFVDAQEQFRRILALDPDHRRAVFSLARSLQEAGQDNEAVATWTRYLELDSTSSWADAARRNLRKLSGAGPG